MKADEVLRTAGSHGFADLVVVLKGHVTFVQCKVTSDPGVAERLLKGFKANPPLTPSGHFHQTLEVKIIGSKEVLSVTI